ncbi:MAG: DUF4157 domain-containing protein [Acidobacteriaceae bacterium]|nr:DUF4157 domain-containing protein [Acidobacteriaceae bacterium]
MTLRHAALLASALAAPNLLHAAADQNFEVIVDASRAPDAQPYVAPVKALLNEWYPKINVLLFGERHRLPFNKIEVIFESNMDSRQPRNPLAGASAYTKGNVIHVDFGYLRRMRSDYRGLFIHELTHVNQHYKRVEGDGWLVEGIASYVRHKYFDKDIEPALRLQSDGKARGYPLTSAQLTADGYKFGYTIASAFLFWLEQQKDPNIVLSLNEALSKGRYSDKVFLKRCGAPLPQLWSEFLAFSVAKSNAG